jgi:prepilin-type N-terminal cleavage/methylation domain-containing protein
MSTHVKNNQAGFTLIEYIVALVVAAIVAAMVYTYFGSALTQSSIPIERLRQVSNLQQVMENISADYNRLNKINLRYKWRSNFPYSIGDVVLPSNSVNNDTSTIDNNGRYYICTQAGQSHSANLPGWTITTPPTAGAEITDNTVKWKELGYVWKAGTAYPANVIVVPEISNGHFYRGPGVSFTTTSQPPPWLTGPGVTATEPDTGGQTWTEIGTIFDRTDTTDRLLYYLTTVPDRYGTGYSVVTADTKFIQFSGVSEVNAGASGTSVERNLLKVTIKNNDTAETLSQIFTIR